MALESMLQPHMLVDVPDAMLTRLARGGGLPPNMRGALLQEMQGRVRKYADGGLVLPAARNALEDISTDQLQQGLALAEHPFEREQIQAELNSRAAVPDIRGAASAPAIGGMEGDTLAAPAEPGMRAADYARQDIQAPSALQEAAAAPKPAAKQGSALAALAQPEGSLWENPAFVTGLALMANRSRGGLFGALGEAGMVGAQFANRAKQDRQRGTLFDAQMKRYQGEADKDAAEAQQRQAARQSAQGYIASQPEGKRPALQAAVDADPAGFAKYLAQQTLEGPKAPEVRTFRAGDRDETRQYDPQSGQWITLASGRAFAPTQPRAPEQAVEVLDDQGNVILVPLSQAYGRRPAAKDRAPEQAVPVRDPVTGKTVLRKQSEAYGLEPGAPPDNSIASVYDDTSPTGARNVPRAEAIGRPAVTASGGVQQGSGALPSDMAGKAAALRVVAQDLPTFESFYFPEGKYAGRIAAGTAAYPGVGQFLDPNAGAVRTKMLGALDAALRIKTGAGMNKEEIPFYERQYIPGPSDNEQTARAKLDGLRSFVAETTEEIDRSRKGGPQAAGPQRSSAVAPQAPGNAFTQRGQQTPQQPQANAPPAPGTITEGNGGVRYRFKGGDPGNRANWEAM